MDGNSLGLIVIGVSYQGVMHLEEIELHLEKAELLQGVPSPPYLGNIFMLRWNTTQ